MCFADGDRAGILRFILENTIVALFADASADKFVVSRVRQQGRAADSRRKPVKSQWFADSISAS